MDKQFVCQTLDGRAVSAAIRSRLTAAVAASISLGRRPPGLSVVLVGDDPASQIYVRNKIQACQKVGIESVLKRFPAGSESAEILETIAELNADSGIDGILVQLPLPAHLPTEVILDGLSPDKDVDGLHPVNLGRLLGGKSGLRPCTPQGIIALLDHYEIPTAGRRAVVVGRSNLVGKPISLMLMERNATVTMCHSRSTELPSLTREADILVVAAGRPELVRGDWIKPGAVVVDVGIHRRETDGGGSVVVGDVAYDEALTVASYLTPVPGGVGPMTVALLLSNTVQAYTLTAEDITMAAGGATGGVSLNKFSGDAT